MKIVRTIEFAATPDVVFTMVIDEDFQRRKCIATGSVGHEVELESMDPPTMVAARTMPTTSFPSFVASMVGPTVRVEEVYVWSGAASNGSRDANLKVTVGALPVAMAGLVSLRPGGAGTTMTFDCEITARIPLIGDKVEQAAAPAILGAIRYEHETGLAWLGERTDQA